MAFLAIFLNSCAPENRIYEKHQSLSPNVEWLKTDKKTFEVDINDPVSTYQFNLALRYATGYMWNEAKIIVEEISPSGMKIITPYTLKIREDNGDYIGEPGYDIWDSTHLVDANYNYKENGKYTYVLSHDMPRDEFPFAMEVGLIIDKNI
jgi:gliding motility-associated lipoprotein GldH